MGKIVRLLHSRTRRIGAHSIQLIYRDGSSVFVERWLRKKSGSLQLVSTGIFRGDPTIMSRSSVGLPVRLVRRSMEPVNVTRVPL